jgi:hypothetical protein
MSRVGLTLSHNPPQHQFVDGFANTKLHHLHQQLVELRLHGNQLHVDPHFASLIARFRNLTTLDISANKVTQQGWQRICNMVSLTSLNAHFTGVKDEWIVYLTRLDKLQCLLLGSTQASATSVLALLSTLPTLRLVEIDRAGKLSTQQQSEATNQLLHQLSLRN